VITKPRGGGGHSPRWATEAEVIIIIIILIIIIRISIIIIILYFRMRIRLYLTRLGRRNSSLVWRNSVQPSHGGSTVTSQTWLMAPPNLGVLSFLGAFAKLRKATIEPSLSVCPSAWKNSALKRWILIFNILVFFRKYFDKIQVSFKYGKNNG
jgi:hypothetical protein